MAKWEHNWGVFLPLKKKVGGRTLDPPLLTRARLIKLKTEKKDSYSIWIEWMIWKDEEMIANVCTQVLTLRYILEDEQGENNANFYSISNYIFFVSIFSPFN